MLDPKFIRENPDAVRRAITLKNGDVDVDAIAALDDERRRVVSRGDELKAERNAESKRIAEVKKAGGDATDAVQAMKRLGEEVKAIDVELGAIQARLDEILPRIPNVPDDDVPEGASDEDNRFEREWGERPADPGFPRKPHHELGEALGILDLKAAAKTSGTGFFFLKGAGARLERSLINFMIDLHVREHGYTEVQSPFLVRPHCCLGTGQLPKFGDDMYRIDRDDLYLIPTAEVPLTNMCREQVLEHKDLPMNIVGQSGCFRREAGSHGKDTTGLQRVHQFQKVELVKLVKPEDSEAALETLTDEASSVLRALGLHHRVVTLCTGDLGFASAKTYDIEVWAPGLDRYLEVSSCSNFRAFQARRASIRFRDEKKKVQHVHTLNGSGVALPRLMVALLETYQQRGGTVAIPEVLQPYFGSAQIAAEG